MGSEQKNKYIQKHMSSSHMKFYYPDTDKRLAASLNLWESKLDQGK